MRQMYYSVLELQLIQIHEGFSSISLLVLFIHFVCKSFEIFKIALTAHTVLAHSTTQMSRPFLFIQHWNRFQSLIVFKFIVYYLKNRSKFESKLVSNLFSINRKENSFNQME